MCATGAYVVLEDGLDQRLVRRLAAELGQRGLDRRVGRGKDGDAVLGKPGMDILVARDVVTESMDEDKNCHGCGSRIGPSIESMAVRTFKPGFNESVRGHCAE